MIKHYIVMWGLVSYPVLQKCITIFINCVGLFLKKSVVFLFKPMRNCIETQSPHKGDARLACIHNRCLKHIQY